MLLGEEFGESVEVIDSCQIDFLGVGGCLIVKRSDEGEHGVDKPPEFGVRFGQIKQMVDYFEQLHHKFFMVPVLL